MRRSASFVIMALAATSVAVESASAQEAKPLANATNRNAKAIDPKAKAILDRHAAATKPASAPKYRHVVIEVRSGDSPPMQLEKFTMLPDKILTRTTYPALGTTEAGYDGKIGWSMSPLTGPMLLEGEPLNQLKATTGSPVHVSADDFVELKFVGREALEGRAVNAVLAVGANGDAATYYFDVESGLLAGYRPRTTDGQPADTTNMMLFGDYKRFSGTLQPTKLTVRAPGYDIVTRVLHVDQDSIDAAKFAPPAAVRALGKAAPGRVPLHND
jgi:hypothetical protein